MIWPWQPCLLFLLQSRGPSLALSFRGDASAADKMLAILQASREHALCSVQWSCTSWIAVCYHKLHGCLNKHLAIQKALACFFFHDNLAGMLLEKTAPWR